jgi:hypothetical protein
MDMGAVCCTEQRSDKGLMKRTLEETSVVDEQVEDMRDRGSSSSFTWTNVYL